MLNSRVLARYSKVRDGAEWRDNGTRIKCQCKRCKMGRTNGIGFRVITKNNSRVTVELVTSSKEKSIRSRKSSSEQTLPLGKEKDSNSSDTNRHMRAENQETNSEKLSSREKLSPSIESQPKLSSPEQQGRLVLSAPESPAFPQNPSQENPANLGVTLPSNSDELLWEENIEPYQQFGYSAEKERLALNTKASGDLEHTFANGRPITQIFVDKLGRPLIENTTPAVRDTRSTPTRYRFIEEISSDEPIILGTRRSGAPHSMNSFNGFDKKTNMDEMSAWVEREKKTKRQRRRSFLKKKLGKKAKKKRKSSVKAAHVRKKRGHFGDPGAIKQTCPLNQEFGTAIKSCLDLTVPTLEINSDECPISMADGALHF